jgi:hypothetical protein
VVRDAFAEAAFRGSAVVLPTAVNLDPETALFAAWCAADLAADFAVFLVAITLPFMRVYPKQPKRGSKAGTETLFHSDLAGCSSLPMG